MQRLLAFFLGMLLLAFCVLLSANQKLEAIEAAKSAGFVVLPEPKKLESFELSDMNAAIFTDKNLLGHYSLVFFGFTNSPYVCPTIMTHLSKMHADLLAQLPQSLVPQVIFITVDPDQDSAETLKEYVRAFIPDNSALGLRGSTQQIDALAQQLGLSFQTEKEMSSYARTHSAEIAVIDPQGKLFAYFSLTDTSAQLVQNYKHVLQHALGT